MYAFQQLGTMPTITEDQDSQSTITPDTRSIPLANANSNQSSASQMSITERRTSARLLQPGPGGGRVVVAGEPQHRLQALETAREAAFPGEPTGGVRPHDLQVRHPDHAVERVGDRHQPRLAPAQVDRAERNRGRADVVEHRLRGDLHAVGGPRADRVDDRRGVLHRQAAQDQLRHLAGEPHADAVRPRRRLAVGPAAGDGPAVLADRGGDPVQVVHFARIRPGGIRLVLGAVGAVPASGIALRKVHARHATPGVRHSGGRH